MADVPDQPVARCVEHVMQRHREFDHPQATAEMSTRFGRRCNDLGPQFRRQPRQVCWQKPPEGLGRGHSVDEGCQSIHTLVTVTFN